MIDISHKIETLRMAIASSQVIAKKETLDRAMQGDTPKGDVLNIAKAAGMLAAKKTPELIPHCHPLSLDNVEINFKQNSNAIQILVCVKAVGKTGVEMEALTAASITALTIYDILKPIDQDMIIGETKLIEKRGGKSDFQDKFKDTFKVAVLVTSDSVFKGDKTDKSGKIICKEMKKFPVEVCFYEIIPDEKNLIQNKVLGWTEKGIDIVITTGGTGLGPRDVTVDALEEVIEKKTPGIAEAMRAYGQRRTPYAMLSRSIVGTRGKTLLLTLPGSSRGVKECLSALFPNVLHIFSMMRGGGH